MNENTLAKVMRQPTQAECTAIWHKRAQAAEAQRDELLAACKFAVAKMQEAGIGFGETELRAAIANVGKGEK